MLAPPVELRHQIALRARVREAPSRRRRRYKAQVTARATSKVLAAKGSASTLAHTGLIRGRRVRTCSSATGDMSTPTTVPSAVKCAPFPPVPQPASRTRGCPVSHGPRRSRASARVLLYHQWSSSTAAMRAYSSNSTGTTVLTARSARDGRLCSHSVPRGDAAEVPSGGRRHPH